MLPCEIFITAVQACPSAGFRKRFTMSKGIKWYGNFTQESFSVVPDNGSFGNFGGSYKAAMFTKALSTIALLVVSNTFMTFAWYGHLKFDRMRPGDAVPLIAIILISWGIAFVEYCFLIPANRIGFVGNGGPFSVFQLKIVQEVISLVVFSVLALLVFRTETFRVNYLFSFLCLVLAVWFAFKK